MKKTGYFLILLTCISCNTIKKNTYNPAKKYSALQLREDFSVLHKVLKANHPSLYWYSPKDSVDNLFLQTYTSLHDSLTERQFRNRVAWVINKIHCGHTVVRPSKKYSKYYSRQKVSSFPFLLKVWQDSAVVITNLVKEDTVIKRGTTITAINEIPVKTIIDSLCQLISSDGYSNIFQYQAISFNFPAYYRNAYGLDSIYTIQYKDSTGKLSKTISKNFESNADSLNNTQQLLPTLLTKKQLRRFKLLSNRNLEIDTSLHTAFMSVNTFEKGRLIRFFHKSFKKIKQRKVKNVVIDLRLNTGGSVLACARLSQYLVNKPFHIADTVATYNRSFRYKKYIKPWFIYWLSMHISGRRYADGRIHFRYFEKHLFRPKKENHFNGHVYLLTGGFTFSAATLVAGNLKGQSNATIVGEETGGGAYGNSAMLLTTIVLPKTGLRITLPLYKMVLDARRPKNGHGVSPDVEVQPSAEIIKKGVDAKLEKAKELILKSK